MTLPGSAAPDVEVCVIGAGPAGGVLACLLADAGVSTAVVDRAALPPMEHPAFDGRCYAIAAGSRAILEQAGLWAALPWPSGPIREIRISDGSVGRPASRLHLHFRAEEVGETAFGWMVEARSLRIALNARMHALENLAVHAPRQARVERTAEAAVVELDTGERITCRLVVAAEGRDSPLRNGADIAVTRFAYRQTGLVGAMAHDRPHGGVALEHFLPAGPFAQLPMAATETAPNASAFVWTERTDTAARLLALGEQKFNRELQRRLGSHLGQVRLIGRRWSYPLGALHAHRYADTRLAVVGDAAHGIHPVAGQGLNLGLRDVAALARLVSQTVAAGQDPGAPALLRRYQSLRRPANLAMLAATDMLDRLFSTDASALRLARDVGIAAVHRIGPLKRAFMRTAMGA
jgi:2-octaprenyl-6-methoxyphenol hydroxylase